MKTTLKYAKISVSLSLQNLKQHLKPLQSSNNILKQLQLVLGSLYCTSVKRGDFFFLPNSCHERAL